MHRSTVALSVVFLTGIAIGAATLGLQKILPSSWNQLANSGAVWVVGTFVAGAVIRSAASAAIAGMLVLVGAVIGYYGCTTVLLHQDLTGSSVKGPIAWAVVALLAGPIFGLAGAWSRTGAGADPSGLRVSRRVIALVLLGSVFLAEGVYLLAVVGNTGPAVIMFVIGLAVPLVLGRGMRERLHVVVGFVPVAAVGVLAYLILAALLNGYFQST